MALKPRDGTSRVDEFISKGCIPGYGPAGLDKYEGPMEKPRNEQGGDQTYAGEPEQDPATELTSGY